MGNAHLAMPHRRLEGQKMVQLRHLAQSVTVMEEEPWGDPAPFAIRKSQEDSFARDVVYQALFQIIYQTSTHGEDVELEHAPPPTTGQRFDSRLTGILSVGIAVLVLTAMWWLGHLFASEASGKSPPPSLVERANMYAELVGFDVENMPTGHGIEVCIIDTGIDLSHPDLDHISVVDWKDLVNEQTTPYDDQGHGTAMAGILVANGGFHGLAKEVNLNIVKALAADGNATDSMLADGIEWCIDEKVDLISLSLGGAENIIPALFGGDESVSAIEDALSAGIFVIAAAGNEGGTSDGDDVAHPGGIEDVICVGGVEADGSHWPASNSGSNGWRLFPPRAARSDPDKKPEIVAPAAQVPVIWGQEWGVANGTSAATVYVTAALIHLLEAHPEIRPSGTDGGSRSTIEQVKTWISESSLGSDAHDDEMGYGRLSAPDLLAASG